jgi:CxxC motif-containing protein (DUF1111 family)
MSTKKISFYLANIFFSLAIIYTFSCSEEKKTESPFKYELDEEYTAGKNGTVSDESVNAFNNSIDNLTADENTKFVTGNSFNRNNWVVAPASTTSRDGLGPLFNARSCSGCHRLDGRGKPPEEGGEHNSSFVVRLSIPGADEYGFPNPIPNYGDQLQQFAIPNVKPEGKVKVSYEEIEGAYPDGTTYSLRKPSYEFVELAYGDFPNDFMSSTRIAPKMTGAGMFDGIDDATILANADPDDANADGISGKANYAWDFIAKKRVVGRIGWKASVANSTNQVARAFVDDIGITNPFFEKENLWGIQKQNYDTLINGGKPEIDLETIQKVMYYTAALAMPSRRGFKDESVLKGKTLFKQIGCSKCHVSELKTSTHPQVSQLSNQTLRLYSDLLLHDMGPTLSDNRPDGEATGREWRTPPLWGLGYNKIVSGYEYYLHDGRARTPEEAILWHGGEALTIKDSFMKLSKLDRESILKFLQSL